MIRKLSILLLILLNLVVSCKKDNTTPSTEVTPAMARDTLYYVMKQFYYWYDKMPSVTKENYKDPYEILEAMRYKALDRWSFVADYDEFNAEMQGTFVGHGFRIGLDDNYVARIAMIYSQSPLYKEGVRRGWIVKKINGTDIAPVLIAGDATTYNNLIGPSTENVTNTFLFQRPDGTDVTITSTKKSFTINTVLLYDTLHLKSGITGHLVFESFILPSDDELKVAFSYFKANNIKDLILDIRYNSGGYLSIAQNLASYIGGNGLAGMTFAKLSYNAKNQDANTTFPFKSTSYSIGLSRMVVITTRSTASASEAVMNGLRNHITVVSVGDTTNGKPTGMNGWSCGKKYWFWPVTFKMVNSSDQGDYFDGFAPDKVASDDIAHDFNDRKEACMKQAINYLETGTFTGVKGAAASEGFYRHVQIDEKPSWMSNTFGPEKKEAVNK